MFSPAEKEDIKKYFGVEPKELSDESFRSILRNLRSKYHPDNFEKFADETVQEMATERFQRIEYLAGKLETYLSKGKPDSGGLTKEQFQHTDAQFAARKLKLEVITRDKDLKYQLFGTFYRWLVMGDKYKIPDTGASIIIDENHKGTKIGFQESVRMYLTFDEDDAIDTIVDWLYLRIKGRADSLLIRGDSVPVDREAILENIKRITFLRIAAPS